VIKEYTDKQINSMILHLRLKDIAEIYYLDIKDPETRTTHDRGFYDYKTNSWISRKELIASALETDWKESK